MLAAAAWCEGGIAVQEYAAPKTFRRARYPGRTDLWIRTRTGYDYVVEAKVAYVGAPGTTRTSTIDGRLDAHLAWAKDDARHTARADAEHVLAVVFVVPLVEVPKKEEEQQQQQQQQRARLDELLRLTDRDDVDVWAWAPTADPPSEEGYAYPGVLLLGVSR